MKELQLLLDNGHGNNTAGKCWTIGGVTFYEWECNRDIIRRVCEQLDIESIPYHIIVPEDYDVSLKERCRRANAICAKYGKDNCLFISAHSNASVNHDAHGISIWTSKGQTKSDKYAEEWWYEGQNEFVHSRMMKDMSDGDHDFESNFYVLKHTVCAAVLIEAFFYDNKKDFYYLLSEEGREQIAKWYVNSIKRCIELHKKL